MEIAKKKIMDMSPDDINALRKKQGTDDLRLISVETNDGERVDFIACPPDRSVMGRLSGVGRMEDLPRFADIILDGCLVMGEVRPVTRGDIYLAVLDAVTGQFGHDIVRLAGISGGKNNR